MIDNTELEQQPIQYLRSGHFNRVPVVLGTNLNEMSLFLCYKFANITADEYVNLVLRKFY